MAELQLLLPYQVPGMWMTEMIKTVERIMGTHMYCDTNFGTKKDLKTVVAAGGRVTVHQPFQGTVPRDGEVSVEGPWYPQPHRWYARVTLKDGVIVKVR